MNKTVLITGTSSGFGKSASKLFAANGWNVIATMRNPEKEEELTNIKDVLVTRLDVQDPKSIEEAIAQGIDRFGNIDAVVNNAGYGTFGIFEAASMEQIKRQFDVNVYGLMEVTRAILPHFRKNKSGLFINISSMGGRITLPMMSLYHASKFAIEGFTESLFHELLSMNIHVKLVEPGGVSTNFGTTSMERFENQIPDYTPFIENCMANFQEFFSKREPATVDEVAQTILTAATDDKIQLRYVIGKDAQNFIDRRQSGNDQVYVDYMKDFFGSHSIIYTGLSSMTEA